MAGNLTAKSEYRRSHHPVATETSPNRKSRFDVKGGNLPTKDTIIRWWTNYRRSRMKDRAIVRVLSGWTPLGGQPNRSNRALGWDRWRMTDR